MSDPSAATLSPREISALVVLLAEARELRNPELRQIAGVDLTGEARRSLVRLGLVAERAAGRAKAFALTDRGWATSLELLARQQTLPGASGGALSALLRALGRGLPRQGLVPRSLFQTEFQAGPASPSTAALDPEDRVRAAYAKLAPNPAAWVTLADLRDALAELPRREVDAALRGLARRAGVRLIPVANLKALTKRDHDAALRLGGEDNHVLSIEAA